MKSASHRVITLRELVYCEHLPGNDVNNFETRSGGKNVF